MNEEMKKIFEKFLLVTVIIACVGAVFACSITVGERGEYNLNMTEYAVMSFSGTSEKIEAEFSENRLSIEVPLNKAKNKIEDYICLTPFSAIYYLIKSVESLTE